LGVWCWGVSPAAQLLRPPAAQVQRARQADVGRHRQVSSPARSVQQSLKLKLSPPLQALLLLPSCAIKHHPHDVEDIRLRLAWLGGRHDTAQWPDDGSAAEVEAKRVDARSEVGGGKRVVASVRAREGPRASCRHRPTPAPQFRVWRPPPILGVRVRDVCPHRSRAAPKSAVGRKWCCLAHVVVSRRC
jgi:hypothetical protein